MAMHRGQVTTEGGSSDAFYAEQAPYPSVVPAGEVRRGSDVGPRSHGADPIYARYRTYPMPVEDGQIGGGSGGTGNYLPEAYGHGFSQATEYVPTSMAGFHYDMPPYGYGYPGPTFALDPSPASSLPMTSPSLTATSLQQASSHYPWAPPLGMSDSYVLDPGAEGLHDVSSNVSSLPSPVGSGLSVSDDAGSHPGLECPECGKEFRRNSDLTKHRRYHTKGFMCDLDSCKKTFATAKDLKRHSQTHKRDTGYRCPVPGCGKAKSGHIYNRRDNFLRHIRTRHAAIPGLEDELHLSSRATSRSRSGTGTAMSAAGTSLEGGPALPSLLPPPQRAVGIGVGDMQFEGQPLSLSMSLPPPPQQPVVVEPGLAMEAGAVGTSGAAGAYALGGRYDAGNRGVEMGHHGPPQGWGSDYGGPMYHDG